VFGGCRFAVLQVGLLTSGPRFDEAAFSTIERNLFDRDLSAIKLCKVKSFTFQRMGDSMFEPANWHRFKAFINRLSQRLHESS
jgi:beta-amylase